MERRRYASNSLMVSMDELHVDELPVVLGGHHVLDRHAAIGITVTVGVAIIVAIAVPARSIESLCRRRCWRRLMRNGVGRSHSGAVVVPARPLRPSARELPRHPACGQSKRERTGKRGEGKR
jgi:hypothetical protein